jgi:hypothetical protein
VADARPDLVKALIEVEPSGPPLHDVDASARRTIFMKVRDAARGLGVLPLNYMPRANTPASSLFQEKPTRRTPCAAGCKSPARQLPNIAKVQFSS